MRVSLGPSNYEYTDIPGHAGRPHRIVIGSLAARHPPH